MSYFFSDHLLQPGEPATLAGEEARHIKGSRRLKPGDSLVLQDPGGDRFRAVLEHAGAGVLHVRVGERVAAPRMPSVRLVLLQAAVKLKAAEWIVQKATELGVAEVRFFPSVKSPVAVKELKSAKTLSRWERIAREACKQSDRQHPPLLGVSHDLAAALSDAGSNTGSNTGSKGSTGGRRWMLHPQGDTAPGALHLRDQTDPSAWLLVGPEGGFTAEEVTQACAHGFTPVRMGQLVLRTETAALAGCTLMLFGH
ncbi:MAG: 16S rRNA (uracil(1498)-N(3))-methyltransferase [SAR324 cluster bacterium]|nr:16S rRNA (uracil(1498)-N(3))-methyltransferase [SAR324 cluster bacterium]